MQLQKGMRSMVFGYSIFCYFSPKALGCIITYKRLWILNNTVLPLCLEASIVQWKSY